MTVYFYSQKIDSKNKQWFRFRTFPQDQVSRIFGIIKLQEYWIKYKKMMVDYK